MSLVVVQLWWIVLRMHFVDSVYNERKGNTRAGSSPPASNESFSFSSQVSSLDRFRFENSKFKIQNSKFKIQNSKSKIKIEKLYWAFAN